MELCFSKAKKSDILKTREKKQIPPNTVLRENLGKLLLDLSKLTFASFILGGILKGELPQYIIIIAGAVIFVLLAVLGLSFTSQKKDRR
jgi:hypothetical protein